MSASTRAGELQLGAHAGQVVDRHVGAEHGREVQDLAGRRGELLVGHRAVGGAEEHGLACVTCRMPPPEPIDW